MIITILIPVKNEKDLQFGLRPVLDSVEKCGYHRGKIEVVFIVVSLEDKGSRTFEGVPVVKVRYAKEYVQGLNAGIDKALGNLVVFADLHTRFTYGKITAAVQCFEQKKGLRTILEKDFFLITKSIVPLPNDLFCLRSYEIMQTLNVDRKILGAWGRIHIKEALRFAYKLDRISILNKLKILRSVAWG